MEKLHTDNPIPGIPVQTFLHTQKRPMSFVENQEVRRLLETENQHNARFLTLRPSAEILGVFSYVRGQLEEGMLSLLAEMKGAGMRPRFYRQEDANDAWVTAGERRKFVFPDREMRTYASMDELRDIIAEDPLASHILDYRPHVIANRVVIATAEDLTKLQGVDTASVRSDVFTGDTMSARFAEWLEIAGVNRDSQVQQNA